MGNKAVIWEWCSVGMLVFALLFTLLYSFGYSTDISNHDYLYYMHLVAEEDYAHNPMIVGTIALYKPIFALFGHNYWMLQKFTWLLNALIALIPYFTLLNGSQRLKYAFLAALAILVLQQRFGCEPYKPAYLFLIIMLTCLVKYIKNRTFVYIVIISLMLSLIAYVRFPSFFVYPMIVLTVVLLNGKHKKQHSLTVLIVPVLLFSWLVTFTNGSITVFFYDLSANMQTASTDDHSISYIFRTEIQSLVHAFGYSFFILLPCFMYVMWKIKQTYKWLCFYVVSVFILMAIVFYHPTQHLSCALMICVTILYCYGQHFSRESIVVSITVIVSAMFCCIGSNCGFVHDYMSVCFLPYFVLYTPSINKQYKTNENKKTWDIVNNGLLRKAFIIFVVALSLATVISRCINIYKNYNINGKIYIVNGIQISKKIENVYFPKEKFYYYYQIQKEYNALSSSYDDVIFWGLSAHLMSYINDKWPITNLWEITSESKYKSFIDFKDYVQKHHPIIIDTEKHMNTELFLQPIGYKKIDKMIYYIYYKE